MSLKRDIELRGGRFPPIELRIKRLGKDLSIPGVGLENFLSYKFDSSMLIPSDSFDFAFAAPDERRTFRDYFQEGDIVQLFANNRQLATGLIDQTEIEVDNQWGEKVSIVGRDLLGQLEDQDAVSVESNPFYASRATCQQVFRLVQQNTRLQRLRTQDAPKKGYLFATEPGETKMTALQRYMEPLNILAWSDPDGTLVMGRPNMAQGPIATLCLERSNRRSNVLDMKATFAAATVPNLIVPIWVGQEQVQTRIAKEQILRNTAAGAARLLNLGHFLPKVVLVSNPTGTSAQELSEVNQLEVVRDAAGGNILRAYAKREAARQNLRELQVQVVVPGHFNELGDPYRVDTCYQISFDRANIVEKMYLYHVQYELTVENGQRTRLFFTRVNTIVADVRAR